MPQSLTDCCQVAPAFCFRPKDLYTVPVEVNVLPPEAKQLTGARASPYGVPDSGHLDVPLTSIRVPPGEILRQQKEVTFNDTKRVGDCQTSCHPPEMPSLLLDRERSFLYCTLTPMNFLYLSGQDRRSHQEKAEHG